jgi:hypothetical protein
VEQAKGKGELIIYEYNILGYISGIMLGTLCKVNTQTKQAVEL